MDRNAALHRLRNFCHPGFGLPAAGVSLIASLLLAANESLAAAVLPALAALGLAYLSAGCRQTAAQTAAVLAAAPAAAPQTGIDLSELQARYELITTNIAASVIIRKVSGEMLLCSPYTQVLTGYSTADISRHTGDFIESLVLSEDHERYRRAKEISAIGEDALVRYRVRHRSGLILWFETRMVPVCNDDGEVSTIMSVTIDVTDSLTYQEQIEQQNRDLSDFAYMVSHDLKAPIFTIKGMADALVEDYGPRLDKEATELLHYIIDGAQRLEKLVASVIEYSALSTKTSERAEVDLNEVVRQVQADLSEQIRSSGASISVGSNLPTVQGDQIRLYQVFSNLLGNALKYRSEERTPEVAISARRINRDYVAVEIKDNGSGIPGDRLDDIWRPYHRAHGADIEGSGIGLACVKKIVERLGGSVSVSSVEGSGSTFCVTFPASGGDPRAVPDDLARLF